MNRLELLLIILVVVGAICFLVLPSNRIKEEKKEMVEQNQKIVSEVEEEEILSPEEKKVQKIMESMTIEEKIGQLFLVRYPGIEKATNEVKENVPGGYILFGVNFKNKTKEQLVEELQNLQNESKTKLLIAVDEEGGSVVRASAYSAFRSAKFKSPQELGSMEQILQDAKEKSAFLKELGINMNLAPVVDVAQSKKSFIYARTYGKNYEETAKYASEVVKTMNQEKMISCLKHFPGYGDNVDTHTGIAIDERSISEFQEKDFLPFMSAIQEGAPAILVNHNIVKCMDETMPATLSPKVHEILRNDLNFSGVIMTDDLAMAAVKSYVEDGNAAVQAVLAGNDSIITSTFEKHQKEVLDAFHEGRITQEMIEDAVKRVLFMKLRYGIIEP